MISQQLAPAEGHAGQSLVDVPATHCCKAVLSAVQQHHKPGTHLHNHTSVGSQTCCPALSRQVGTSACYNPAITARHIVRSHGAHSCSAALPQHNCWHLHAAEPRVPLHNQLATSNCTTPPLSNAEKPPLTLRTTKLLRVQASQNKVCYSTPGTTRQIAGMSIGNSQTPTSHFSQRSKHKGLLSGSPSGTITSPL